MNAVIIASVTTVCVFGGTLFGLQLRRMLPDHHVKDDSKDAVKVAASTISLMAALVLGLLVSSAKARFDSAVAAMTESGAKLILLDRYLSSYGPEAKPIREALRESAISSLNILWPEEASGVDPLKAFEQRTNIEQVMALVRRLQPQTDSQRGLQLEVQKLCQDLLLLRWLQIEQAQTEIPIAFIAILIFWLTALYMSFGLLAPRNATVVTVMFIGALAMATALFLITEMNHPMGGTVKVSSGPIRKAIEHMGH